MALVLMLHLKDRVQDNAARECSTLANRQFVRSELVREEFCEAWFDRRKRSSEAQQWPACSACAFVVREVRYLELKEYSI